MNYTITITDTEIKVDNKTVATITDKEAYTTLSDALYRSLRKDESVYLALHSLSKHGGVRTSRIANFLSMDRSNCTKALERLLKTERIQVVGTTTEETEVGRPSRLWTTR